MVIASVAKALAFLTKLVALAFAVLLAARGVGRGCGCIKPGGDWPRPRKLMSKGGTCYCSVTHDLDRAVDRPPQLLERFFLGAEAAISREVEVGRAEG